MPWIGFDPLEGRFDRLGLTLESLEESRTVANKKPCDTVTAVVGTRRREERLDVRHRDVWICGADIDDLMREPLLRGSQLR